jgi:hypothetical protein
VPLFEPLFRALNDAGCRYVVVGGVAVVLHGHARLTADVDLIVDLEPEGLGRTLDTLKGLSFEPQVPVPIERFADPAIRRAWRDEKGMQVFSLWNRHDPMLVVELFVESPIDFDELWERAETVPVSETAVRVASIPDLIRLKRLAGRPLDLDDVRQLERLARLKGGGRE